ncbi:MAG: hypothetical protein ACTSYI_05300 [Promethearchaeota archaeon]
MEIMEFSQEEQMMLQKWLVRRISFQLVIGAINQLVLGIVTYFLGSIAKMTRFDLFILFSLKNMIFWRTLAYIFMAIGVLSLILSGIFLFPNRNPNIVKIVNLGAYLQIPFVLFGSFIGIILLHNIKLFDNIEKSSLISQPSKSDPQNSESQKSELQKIASTEKDVIKEVSKLLVGVAIYHLGLLTIVYIFTIALSVLEVSLSYPAITMDSVFLYRKILLGLAIFTGIQLGFGIAFSYFWNDKYMKYLAYILTVLQFFLIPIGVFAGISLVNGLRMGYSHNKEKK